MQGINNSFKQAYLKAIIVKLLKEKRLYEAFAEISKEDYQIFRRNLIELGGTEDR